MKPSYTTALNLFSNMLFFFFVCVNFHQVDHFINAIEIVNMLSLRQTHTSNNLKSIFFCTFCLIFSARREDRFLKPNSF